jgi:hypothetical protein
MIKSETGLSFGWNVNSLLSFGVSLSGEACDSLSNNCFLPRLLLFGVKPCNEDWLWGLRFGEDADMLEPRFLVIDLGIGPVTSLLGEGFLLPERGAEMLLYSDVGR